MMPVCRLCGASDEENMVNIFSKNNENIQYVTQIKSYIPILIYRSDPLSKLVCRSCCYKIDSFCQFRDEIIKNNHKSITKLRTIQDDNEVELYLSTLDNFNSAERVKEKIINTELDYNGEISCERASLTEDLTNSKPFIKILTPSKINNTTIEEHEIKSKTDTNVESKVEYSSISENKVRRKFYQPKTLFQLALHSFNLTINPNYEAEERIKRKIFTSKREFIDFERRWKLSLSTRSVNKRIFEECVPVFKNLLNSWQPPIKQIKLETINPLAPEICIALKNSRSNQNTIRFGLDIRLKYPQNRCRYCFQDFCNIEQLALHEASCHIQVFVGARIDSEYWRDYEENMEIRDKWLARKEEICYEDDSSEEEEEDEVREEKEEELEQEKEEELEQDKEEELEQEQQLNDDIIEDIKIKEEQLSEPEPEEEFINEENGEVIEEEEEYEEEELNYEENGIIFKPVEERRELNEMQPLDEVEGKVGNVPFHSLSKKERFQYYKVVYDLGLKRRECPFCKRSFKDSWSVDDHILKNRCRLICPFCHKYFKKDEHDCFYQHLDQHKSEPNYHPLTKRWRKHIIRAQQLLRQQQMKQRMAVQAAQRFFNQNQPQTIRIEPLKMKYLLEKQMHMQQIKVEPGTTSINPTQLLELQYKNTDPKKVSKPYRSYYCRNCYKVFYQEHDLNIHYPECCNQDISFEPTNNNTDDGSSINESSTNQYRLYSETNNTNAGPSSRREIFRCGFCPAIFYNSNARNSHMRVHKEKMLAAKQKSPMMMIAQNYQRIAPRPPSQPKPAPPRIIDENLARLASNPHITIKPSNVKKNPVESTESSSSSTNYIQQINHIPHHLEPLVVTEMRSFQCNPCGQNFPTQKALYEHKRTCRESIESQGSGYITLPLALSEREKKEQMKKFRCTACNKRFISKANLAFHRKNVCTRIKVMECPFCKKKFSTESQYTTHILYNHPE